jgi:hypothetical protein
MIVMLRGMLFQEKLGGEGLEIRAEQLQYQLPKVWARLPSSLDNG